MNLLKFKMFILLFGLSACAVTPLPPPPITHPASPAGIESKLSKNRDRLVVDDTTKTAEQLLRGSHVHSFTNNTTLRERNP